MLRFPYTQVSLGLPAITLGNATNRHLPLVSVGVDGPTRTSALPCRVDSGSDDTIFPEWLAAIIGIDLTTALISSSQVPGGAILTYRCARVTLRLSDGLESCCWDAVVGFLPSTSRLGLLGIAGCLEYFDTTLRGLAREVLLDPTTSFPGIHFIHGGGTSAP